MVYILILVLASSYGGTPLGTTTVEFNSESACKYAVETIRKNNDGITVRGAYCVQKGK